MRYLAVFVLGVIAGLGMETALAQDHRIAPTARRTPPTFRSAVTPSWN